MFMMTLEDIRNNYNQGMYQWKGDPDEVNLKKVRDDYIFDEDLTVRQNRQMVQEHNAKVMEARQRRYQGQSDLDRKLNADVDQALVEEYGLTEVAAARVRAYAYEQWHSCMSDFFSGLYELADLAKDIFDMGVASVQGKG